MTTNDFDAKVRGRSLRLPVVDGLSELEMNAIVARISEEMKKIEDELNIVDTSKIAIIAAYSFAARLYTMEQRAETNREADAKRLDEMADSLEKALAAEEEKKR